MKRLTLAYLASYLAFGGIGFAFAPGPMMRLFLSDGSYGSVMPRLVGMFMIVLSGLIWLFVRNEDYRYYRYTVAARTGIVLFLGMG